LGFLHPLGAVIRWRFQDSLCPGAETSSVLLSRSVQIEARGSACWPCSALKNAQNGPVCAPKVGFCDGLVVHGTMERSSIFFCKHLINMTYRLLLVETRTRKGAFQGIWGGGGSHLTALSRPLQQTLPRTSMRRCRVILCNCQQANAGGCRKDHSLRVREAKCPAGRSL
jgi:hypothetical protein